jgi:hypothetical protein
MKVLRLRPLVVIKVEMDMEHWKNGADRGIRSIRRKPCTSATSPPPIPCELPWE